MATEKKMLKESIVEQIKNWPKKGIGIDDIVWIPKPESGSQTQFPVPQQSLPSSSIRNFKFFIMSVVFRLLKYQSVR